jgi:hypothetical protein
MLFDEGKLKVIEMALECRKIDGEVGSVFHG